MNKVIIHLVIALLGISIGSLAGSGQVIQGEIEAFKNTRSYQLTANSYSLDDYNNVISNVFLKFLKTHPQSPLCADVENTLKSWISERDHVAQNSIKSNNQWYHGDEAKQMLAKMQFTQLMTEGDRQLQAEKYELAIKQFQQALQVKPITQEALSLIEAKCEYAFTKWAAVAALAPSNSDSDVQSRKQTIERLQNQINHSSQEIAKVEQENILIASAKWVELSRPGRRGPRCSVCGATQGHWIAPNKHDFGPTLPKPNTLGLAGLRRTISDAQNEIAKLNSVIGTLQSGATTAPQALASIQSLRSQVMSEIVAAKAPPAERPPKMEIAPALVNTGGVQQTPVAPSEPVQPTTPQTAISSQESARPVESQPVVAQPRDSVPESSPPQKQPWWKEFWYLIVIGIIGAIYILRH